MYIVGKTMEGRFVPEQTEIKKVTVPVTVNCLKYVGVFFPKFMIWSQTHIKLPVFLGLSIFFVTLNQ
jgi:hypothetical protein